MTAYFDASVILRILFGEPSRLVEWESIGAGWTSALTRVECARTIDRVRLLNLAPADETGRRLPALEQLLQDIHVIDITPTILSAASKPLPSPLATLDALHLASALAWRDTHQEEEFVLATHDRALGRAARIMGLVVIGTT